MKCIDLIATQYVCLAECNALVMQKGDIILVDERVADRMCLQHKMTKGDSHDLGKLLYGHWQPRKMTKDAPAQVSEIKEPMKKFDPDADLSDVPPAEDFEPVDKSMGTQDGKPKTAKKKKKTTTKG